MGETGVVRATPKVRQRQCRGIGRRRQPGTCACAAVRALLPDARFPRQSTHRLCHSASSEASKVPAGKRAPLLCCRQPPLPPEDVGGGEGASPDSMCPILAARGVCSASSAFPPAVLLRSAAACAAAARRARLRLHASSAAAARSVAAATAAAHATPTTHALLPSLLLPAETPSGAVPAGLALSWRAAMSSPAKEMPESSSHSTTT